MAGKIRSRALSTVIGLAGLLFMVSLAAAPQSRAATTIGSDLTAGPTNSFASAGITHSATAIPGRQVTSPITGVIVRWRIVSSSPGGTAQLRVLRPQADGSFMGAGTSATGTVGADSVHEFPTRLAIAAGDYIGVDQLSAFTVSRSNLTAGATTNVWNPALGAAERRAPTGSTTDELLLNADVEADCDSDGFGDETQDPDILSCSPPPPPPSDGSTPPPDGSGGSDPPPPPGGSDPPLADMDPPETTITKEAPDTTDASTVKFKFRSDEPGSTFQCKFDKTPWRTCTSPRTVKRLDEGKHKFKVRAKDAAGNVDPTAAKDGFKVVD